MSDDPATRTLALLESLHTRLDHLDARLDRLESRLEPALGGLDQAQAAVAMAVDTLDGLAARAGDLHPDERVRTLGRAAELLTRPELLALLERVAARSEALGAAVELVDAAPQALAGLTDTLDAHLGAAVGAGLDVDQRLRSLGRAAEVLTRPELLDLVVDLAERSAELSRVMRTLLAAGVLDAPAVSVVGHAGEALAQSRSEPLPRVGLLDLLGALRDADINRALSFGLGFARRFGARLHPST